MNIVQIKDLNKFYRKCQALNSIDLNLDSGKIIGLVGPNGSGKTSLLRILGGFDMLYTGDIKVEGHRPASKEAKALTSYLPDFPSLADWQNSNQLIAMYQEYFPDFNADKAKELLAFFKLDPQQKIKTMSKGMREKLQILVTISRQAKLYLLDEPISGVDPATRKVIIQSIIRNYAEDAFLIIATHLIYDIESIIDDVIFLNQGKVQLFSSADTLREKENKSINTIFEEAFR